MSLRSRAREGPYPPRSSPGYLVHLGDAELALGPGVIALPLRML